MLTLQVVEGKLPDIGFSSVVKSRFLYLLH